MWSEILGLGMSAIGAVGARSDARAARAQQEWIFRQQMDMARANQAIAMDAQRRQEEDNRYRRNIENLNRRIAQDERDYQISRIERNCLLYTSPRPRDRG